MPTNLFTVTQAQVSTTHPVHVQNVPEFAAGAPFQVEQLKYDNVVTRENEMPPNHLALQDVLSGSSPLPLRSLEEILPTYIK